MRRETEAQAIIPATTSAFCSTMSDAEEVGKTALYLCSDWGSAVTGEVMHVDAGYNIMGM